MVLNASSDGFSDLRLVLAMERLSMQGRLAYTDHQLHYAVAGEKTIRKALLTRLRRKPGHPDYRGTPHTYEAFQQALGRWTSAGGRVHGRLLPVGAMGDAPNRTRAAGSTGLPPDLAGHGFDRVVVVDSVATAVMLVANNAHVDLRCAVLSEDGYPEAFAGELVELLNQNPALTVVAAHGASLAGCGLARRLRTWFPQARIIDVGLRPAQIRAANLYAERDPQAAAGGAGPGGGSTATNAPNAEISGHPDLLRLDEWEREWLGWGLYSPLATVGPTRLIRVLSQAFANAAMLDEQSFADPSGAAPRAVERNRRHQDTTDGGIYWWDDHQPDDDEGFGADFDGDG